MAEVNLACLFDSEPFQWGLRGDPFLWREMKERIKFSLSINTAVDFEDHLHRLFLELTNVKLENNGSVFIERYNIGGMSSGYVSTEFWLKTGFPLLVARFKELHVK